MSALSPLIVLGFAALGWLVPQAALAGADLADARRCRGAIPAARAGRATRAQPSAAALPQRAESRALLAAGCVIVAGAAWLSFLVGPLLELAHTGAGVDIAIGTTDALTLLGSFKAVMLGFVSAGWRASAIARRLRHLADSEATGRAASKSGV